MDLNRLHFLKNILYREPSFISKYYLFHKNWESDKVDYVYMADGKMVHGGLFDRLKGAISIYALSKVHGKKFGIYFKEPFELEKYLKPSKYDWKVEDNNVIYCYPISRPVIAYSENRRPNRLLKERKGQIHFYFGGDMLGFINQKYGTNFIWTSLFNELFTPSDILNNYVGSIIKDIGSSYNAVHLRFVNLLGDNIEKNRYPELEKEEKLKLIEYCVKRVSDLYILSQNDGRRLVVASDSKSFLEILKYQVPEVYIVSGDVNHLDKAESASKDAFLKLFTDVFLLAGSEVVYSIIGKGLYSSAFPEYSAKIGGNMFVRVSI